MTARLCRAAAFAGAFAFAFVVAPGRADAFVTSCHQGITTDVLAGATWPAGAVPPPLVDDYTALLNELTIDVAPQVQNFWALSALVGNLYNDLGPYDFKDIASLADYAARPELQRTHCLRAPADDGAAGDVQALAACKAFVLDEIALAVGDSDTVDDSATEAVRLHLVFRGDADVPFQRFAFHLGRATHALQDSFTHTFRSADKQKVRTVLNWVEWVTGGYAEERDGFRHLSALDVCGAGDEGGLERRMAASQATSALVAAVADDTGGRAGRLARAGAVVDAWFGVEPGCTQATHWCDAPEQTQTGTTVGCAVAPGGGGARLPPLAVALVAVGAGSRRRRRRGHGHGRRAAVAAMMALYLTIGGGAAGVLRAEQRKATAHHHDDADAADHDDGKAKPDDKGGAGAQPDSDRDEVKGRLITKATPEEQRLLALRRLGVLVQGGIAIDNGAYQVGAGVRYDLSKAVSVGLGAEYNPWFSFETGKMVRGTTNVFAVGVYRLDVRDYLELRLTGSAGASILNFDTWAAKSGSVGPYFALSPLGVAIRMGGHMRFLVDPAEIVFAMPQTRGIPLTYRQHRFSVGLQTNF